MTINNSFKFIFAIAISQAAGIIGSIFTVSAIQTWYTDLIKPVFNPPNWLFAPVWTILYFLMGIAAYLIWKEGLNKKEVRLALGLFLIQLMLNALWSMIFFGLQNPSWAFAEIIILWLAILATLMSFIRISKTAAWLLSPYFLWVNFAAYLNCAIWLLN